MDPFKDFNVRDFFSALLVVVMLIFVIIVIFGILKSNSSSYDGDISTNSESDLILSTSPNLLEYSTVKSLSVTSPNQTWLDFDGVNDWVNITNVNPLDFDNSTNFTIMFFIKSNVTPSASQFIFEDNQGGNNYVDIFIDTSMALNVRLCDSTGNKPTAPNITNNSWNQIALVGLRNYTNASQTGKYYFNSVFKNSISRNPMCNLTGSASLYLGRRAAGGYFNGSIEEVKIFNKEVIQRNMNTIYNSSWLGGGYGKLVPVIYYHDVANYDEPNMISEPVNLTEFDRQLSYLNSSGFRTITAVQFYNYTQGNYALPNKPIIIMFDDARISVYTNASSIMAKYGYIGVLPIITNYTQNGGSYMTWTQLSTLKLLGWEMASHTVTGNSNMTNITQDNRTMEFNQSRYNILGNLSVWPTTWVFPSNIYNESVSIECGKFYTICSGQQMSATSTNNIILVSSKDNLTYDGFRRIGIYNSTSYDAFKEAVNPEDGLVLKYNLNENNGTIAYDSSGNSNNGTISGATWQTDGQTKPLVEGVDYNYTSNSYSILNPDYVYSTVLATYTYARSSITNKVGNMSDSITNGVTSFVSGLSPTYSLLAIGIIISLLLVVVKVVNDRSNEDKVL